MTLVVKHTQDWEARFRSGDTPWEDAEVAPIVVELFREHVPQVATVLEIGCGLGTAALWLARQGHHVVACDIAPGAVRVAQERARRAGLAIELRVADVLADTTSLPLSDVVLDRGVLHTFVAQEGRVAFAAAVARLLQPGGLWLDVSGSAETPGDRAAAAAHGFPRLTLTQIVAAVEPHFAILAVKQAKYGISHGRTDFLAFAGVFRRR
ncbi:MAG: class I SAM-dependent methyltransferase [Chloroflexota bacterium]|nr:class I SAM-dependent methyltransferase [Chloroflexota bacterium]